MAKIAFILLCHKNPEAIIRQAEAPAETGDCVAIHFDARARRRGLCAHPRRAADTGPA
jgi:hypothetical protein